MLKLPAPDGFHMGLQWHPAIPEPRKDQGSQLTLHELHVFRAARFDGHVHKLAGPAPETEHGNLAVSVMSVMPVMLVALAVHVKPGGKLGLKTGYSRFFLAV